MLEKIEKLGATLVAITPELPAFAKETIDKHALGFHILLDRGNALAHQFGIVFKLPPELREFYQSLSIDLPASNGEATFELPLPATYIIDRTGVIKAAHIDPDYVKRMEPSDILAALNALT